MEESEFPARGSSGGGAHLDLLVVAAAGMSGMPGQPRSRQRSQTVAHGIPYAPSPMELCRDRFGVHYHPSLDALRAVCRVARMHVPRVMRSFFLEKKTGRLSKLLRSNVGCFLLMSYVYVVENSTTCRNSGFPVQGQVWATLSSKFGRAACRVPYGTHACAPCNAILFSRKKKTGRRSKFLTR